MKDALSGPRVLGDLRVSYVFLVFLFCLLLRSHEISRSDVLDFSYATNNPVIGKNKSGGSFLHFLGLDAGLEIL